MRKKFIPKLFVTVVLCLLIVSTTLPIVAEAKSNVGLISWDGKNVTIESKYLKVTFREAEYIQVGKQLAILLGPETYLLTFKKGGVFLNLLPTGSYKVPKNRLTKSNKPDSIGKNRKGKEDFFLTGYIKYHSIRYYPKTKKTRHNVRTAAGQGFYATEYKVKGKRYIEIFR